MPIDRTIISRLTANDPYIAQLYLTSYLKDETLTAEDIVALIHALKENTCVHHLSLTDLCISPDAEPLLGDLLKAIKMLTTVAMGRLKSSPRGFNLCFSALREVATLQRLLCFDNDLSIEAATTLAGIIRDSRSIVELDLRDLFLYDDAAMVLIDALKTNSSIRVLHIDCHNAPSIIYAYITMLSVNTNLSRVEIRLSELSPFLIHKFGDALKKNRSLTSMTIRYRSGADLLTGAREIFSEASHFYFSALSQKILIERDPWILKCETMFHHFISTGRLDLNAINALLREDTGITAKEYFDADVNPLSSSLHKLYTAWFPPDPFEFRFNDCPRYKSLLTVLQHLANSDYYAAELELQHAEERLGFRHELMRTLAPLLKREITIGLARLPIKKEGRVTETALPVAASFTSSLRRRYVSVDVGFFSREQAPKEFIVESSRIKPRSYTPHFKVE